MIRKQVKPVFLHKQKNQMSLRNMVELKLFLRKISFLIKANLGTVAVTTLLLIICFGFALRIAEVHYAIISKKGKTIKQSEVNKEVNKLIEKLSSELRVLKPDLREGILAADYKKVRIIPDETLKRREYLLKSRFERRRQGAQNLPLETWDSWKCEGCTKTHFNFNDSGTKICSTRNNSEVIDLIMIIITTYSNKEQREAIRQTWTSLSEGNTNNVRYTFLLGRANENQSSQIQEEIDVYDDIIIGDFVDNYNTLTTKTISLMSWVGSHCSRAKFVLKTDDDMWINSKKILSLIGDIKTDIYVGGACLPKVKPVRNQTGEYKKFFISYKSFPFEFYPPYCQGLGILMSADVVNRTLMQASNTPLVPFEDVFLGVCFAKLRVRITCLEGFKDNVYEEYVKMFNIKTCDLLSWNYLTLHQVPIKLMIKAWHTVCQ